MSESLHNMSYQALNIENDEMFIKFNGIAQLINDINETLIERNNQSIQMSDVMNTNILNKINSCKFIFDVMTLDNDTKNKIIIRLNLDPRILMRKPKRKSTRFKQN